MKKVCMAVMGTVMLAASALAAEPPAPDAQKGLETQKDKVSYGIGVQMGRNLKRQGNEFDLDLVVRGMKDGFSGGEILISEQDLRKILVEFQTEMRAKSRQQRSSPPATKP